MSGAIFGFFFGLLAGIYLFQGDGASGAARGNAIAPQEEAHGND